MAWHDEGCCCEGRPAASLRPPAEVLSVGDVGTPRVTDGHVLVRVRAASLHPDVWHVVTGRPYVLRLMGAGLTRPRIAIPGTDVAGDVWRRSAGMSRASKRATRSSAKRS